MDYIRAHQDAAGARFVLAYHDLMLGHKDLAKEQFAKVLGKVPQDQLAAKLLTGLGGKLPANVGKPLAPPVPAKTGINAQGGGHHVAKAPSGTSVR